MAEALWDHGTHSNPLAVNAISGDPPTRWHLVDIISASTAQSFISNVVMKQFVVPQTYNSGFKVGLMSKDVAIAAQLCIDLGCDAPFIQLAQQRRERAREVLGADEDHSKAILAWETP